MVLELLFNAALLIFFAYAYYHIGVSMPESSAIELGAEQWPQLILGTLILLIVVNIVKVYRSTPTEKRNLDEIKNIKLEAVFKSKLFKGIVIILAYAFLLEAVGFILSTFVFLVVYARLIGEKRIKILLSAGFLITFGIYFLFARGLTIMLPRGYGILRTFALFLEAL